MKNGLTGEWTILVMLLLLLIAMGLGMAACGVMGADFLDAWKDYDAIGVKGGNAVLKMDDSSTLRFNAPKTENPTGSVWLAYNNKGNWTGVSILY